MIISAIVATDKNGVIGRDNEIPWYLPADLAYFKRTTMGHPVVMGRNTFRSIGRPLPKRTNIVISRDPFFTAEGILVAHTLDEALELALATGDTEVFIIGGGQIYEQSVAYWDKIYLTKVDTDAPGDTFFPAISATDWRIVSETEHEADEKNEFRYRFIILERVSK